MKRADALLAAAILVGAAALVFARLGRYAFWNDEAYTALLAKSVWRTGDTHAVVGHNIIAFKGGAALEGLKHRFDPPLAYYVAAPFLGPLGDHALAGRLPFALCGLATIALMVRWAWRGRTIADCGLKSEIRNPKSEMARARDSWCVFPVLAIAILGNVSLMLYSRQCRYYALAMLCSTALAYLYLKGRGAEPGPRASEGTPRLQPGRGAETPRPQAETPRLLAMATLSVCLLATNYINYAAFYACAVLDYLVWGRRRRRLTWRDALVLFGPQLIPGALIVSVWNPLGKAVVPQESATWLTDKLTLLWWNLRDLSRCEFGVGLLLPAAPLLYLATRDSWLLRGFGALLVYVAAATMLSPQPVSGPFSPFVADVRYLVPLIPLCIALEVLCVNALTRRATALALPLALVAFGTNLLQVGPLLGDPVRSTLAEYVGELARPRTTAYGAAAAWVNANVAEGESVLVSPVDVASSLMFHAPRAVYAWQLSDPPGEQFRGLPDIHFRGRVPPDCIVAFGRAALPPEAALRDWQRKGWRYRMAGTLHAHWRPGPATDGTRPELFWHAFRPDASLGPSTEAIYVLRRVR